MNTEFGFKHTPYLFYIPKVYHHCTLNNFDFRGDKKIIKAVRGFIEGDARGLFFYGGFGVGKTHLLVSLYRVMVAKLDDVSDIYYTSMESVIKELQSKMDLKESTTDFINYLCDIEILFLDDITAANLESQYTKETLRKIINGRYENELRTCFTSNSGLLELSKTGLHPHAISRIQEMCDIVKIVGEDRRERDYKKIKKV